MTHPIITIDGPAGAGKSTLARMLAEALQLPYMDTGAMFRFIAFKLGPNAQSMEPAELRKIAASISFSLEGKGNDTRLLANGMPMPEEIRTDRISALASALATRPEIREILKTAQQNLGKISPLVAEGRDLGTVVFPQATHKFFLDAKPEVRAQRRWREFQQKGIQADMDTTRAMIMKRDDQDRHRAHAPLKPADDSVCIDTSNLDANEVLNALLSCIAPNKGK